MRPILFYTIITFFCSSYCKAQRADSTADAAKSSLTLGSVYANNASYYGQRSEESTPYIALAANYRFRSGFYLSALSYKLLNDKTSSVSATSLGAGVSFKLGAKVTTDLSYSHSFYPALSPLLQAANADNTTLSITRAGWLNISVTGDYAFGKSSNDGFVTLALSKAINLFSISAKDIVTLTPSADIVGGTQHFYQTYLKEQKIRDSVLGIALPGFGNPSQGSTTTSTTVAKTSFDLLSYNFKFPLAYNRAHYLIEAAYQLSVLSSKAQSGAGKANSFGTLSFYYQF